MKLFYMIIEVVQVLVACGIGKVLFIINNIRKK